MHHPHCLVREFGQAAEAMFPEGSGQECAHPRAGSACGSRGGPNVYVEAWCDETRKGR